MTDDTTHFGYETVHANEKVGRVKAVFDSVSGRYDLMNDLMSFGIHRIWKRQAIALTGVRRGQRVLDLAAGTGDLSSRLSGLVGPEGLVVSSDINESMLALGRDRLLDEGRADNLCYALANAQSLPFADNSFDCVTIGFGLRNFTDKQTALNAIYRALKPGGRLLVLEFSKPVYAPLEKLYDLYSFSLLPKIGKLVADDEASYRYLAESIRMHPDQEDLKSMLETAGFESCDYFNLTGGVVAIHRGFKF